MSSVATPTARPGEAFGAWVRLRSQEATLDGTVSVSGGDGSLSCTIEAGSGANWADDKCSLHVHISVGGGHTYNASW